MRVVITGVAGFIGSTLSEAMLSDGHDVVGIDCFRDYYRREVKMSNLSRSMQHSGFTLHSNDLSTDDLSGILGDADAVFHLAAQAGVRPSWGAAFESYTRDNVLGTQRLLEACRAAAPGKIVFSSSSSVYGNTKQLPVREDSPLRPISPYGVTKLVVCPTNDCTAAHPRQCRWSVSPINADLPRDRWVLPLHLAVDGEHRHLRLAQPFLLEHWTQLRLKEFALGFFALPQLHHAPAAALDLASQAKSVLGRLVSESQYALAQAAAMAVDIRTGRYDEPELRLLPRILRPGDRVVDVGANYGLYAYHLARSVGRAGSVLAFEPIPFTASVLRIVLRVLRVQNVEVIEAACSDTAGQLELVVPVQSNGFIVAGLAHLAHRADSRNGMPANLAFTASRQALCRSVTLDEILPASRRIALIKIDVEGAELSVLRGARHTLRTHRPTIICEVNSWLLEGFGSSPAMLCSFLEDHGYRPCWFVDGNLTESRPSDDLLPNNWVFVPTAAGLRSE